MESIKVTSQTFNAIVLKDKSEECFTIFLDGLSGPVISAPTLDEAKSKFGEAMNLACAVRNLNIFSTAINERDREQREKLAKKKLINSEPIIEYRQIEAALC